MTDSNSGSSGGGGGLSDFMALLSGNNPLALVGRSINQFQTSVSTFMRSVENFNETMEQMNGVARRINRMLDDLEPVIKATVPQLTRTLRAADQMVESMTGPVERVAPGLTRLADTLSSPVLTSFPRDLGQFVEMFGDVARRMQPLGQLAETAGGFFGSMNPFNAFRNATAGTTPAPTAGKETVQPVIDSDASRSTTTHRSRTASDGRKSSARTSTAKKSGAAKSGSRPRS